MRNVMDTTAFMPDEMLFRGGGIFTWNMWTENSPISVLGIHFECIRARMKIPRIWFASTISIGTADVSIDLVKNSSASGITSLNFYESWIDKTITKRDKRIYSSREWTHGFNHIFCFQKHFTIMGLPAIYQLIKRIDKVQKWKHATNINQQNR